MNEVIDTLEEIAEEDWMRDSDMIYTALTNGQFDNYEDVKRCVMAMYFPDMSFSRAGICHALKRLERHYG